MDNYNDNNSGDCCGGSGCGCNQPSLKKNNGKGWKTFAFTAVILLAVGVTSYSLIYKKNSAAGATACAAGSVCGVGGTCAVPCDLNTPTTLIEKRLAESDFLIILFPDAAKAASPGFTQTLETVMTKIAAMGKKPEILTLNPGDPGYDEAIAKFKIEPLPAVLTLGANGGTLLAWDEITEGRLMLEYYRNCSNSAPASSQSD